MKNIIVFAFIALILLLGSQSLAQGIYPAVSGDGVYGDGADTLNVNEYFGIEIYLDCSAPILGWSTPFELYGSGDVAEVSYGPIIYADTFIQTFDIYYMYSEDMDGILPDKFGVYGIAMFGWSPDGPILIFTVNLKVVGDETMEGMLCIDSADMADDMYDWLFELPMPFEEACWPVKAAPFICGDVNYDGKVNLLDVTYLTAYLYLSWDPPHYTNSADVNNSCTINILDITYLIAYLYKDGPEPVCPPQWPCRSGSEQVKNDMTDMVPIKWQNW